MNDWNNFSWLVFVQIIFLWLVIYIHKPSLKFTTKKVFTIIVAGAFFGIIFDLLIGKYAGVYEYQLGFGTLFLILNGLLSFGTMAITIAFLSDCGFWKFYLWTIFLGTTYEIANYFFPVWQWKFMNEGIALNLLVIGCAYFGLSGLIALMLKIIKSCHKQHKTN